MVRCAWSDALKWTRNFRVHVESSKYDEIDYQARLCTKTSATKDILPQRRKGAKKVQRNAAALCVFASLRLCGRHLYVITHFLCKAIRHSSKLKEWFKR